MSADGLRWAAKRARHGADRLVHPARSGVPPLALRARVGAAADYLASGERAADALEAGLAAAAAGVPGAGAARGADPAPPRTRSRFARAAAVLDLGCGAGRVARAVRRRAPAARVCGCDVDAEAIGWARRHLPDVAWAVNGFRPPLPYPDAAFDVVYAVSLLSHLDAPDQDAWLAEVARVLAPGGTALLSVHGPHAFEQFRTGAVTTRWCPPGAFDRAPLRDDEFVYAPYVRTRRNAADLPGIDGSFGVAFHGPAHVRARWPLPVVAVLPRALSDWQDLVVSRAPARR